MRNTNTEIEYPFNLKIKTVFGLVSIVFHCIYSQTEEPTIKQTQWLWSNNTFLSPSLKCVITRLTPKCEWLPRSDTKLYTLPIFFHRRRGEWEERCRIWLGPLSNHSPLALPAVCHSPRDGEVAFPLCSLFSLRLCQVSSNAQQQLTAVLWPTRTLLNLFLFQARALSLLGCSNLPPVWGHTSDPCSIHTLQISNVLSYQAESTTAQQNPFSCL